MTAQDRTTPIADIVNLLAGVSPGDPLDRLRDLRPQAKENAQRSFVALLEPEAPGAFSIPARYAVATFVAGVTGSERARRFYGDVLEDEATAEVAAAVDAAVRAAVESGPGVGPGSGPDAVASSAHRDRVLGPYGDYPVAELAAENVAGPTFRLPAAARRALGEGLAAALEYAHLLVLHPRDSAPRHLGELLDAGWDEDGVVSLAQLISFLSFQIRAAEGLAALGGDDSSSGAAAGGPDDAEAPAGAASAGAALGSGAAALAGSAIPAGSTAPAGSETPTALHERVTEYPDLKRPDRFTRGGLGWLPWIEPVAEGALTDRQREALVERSRTKSPYFRLLVRDPDALEARTLTDFDIFYNVDGGLSRAEREVAATVASRLNGCLFCASIHSHRAVQEDASYLDAVQRLLDDGVEAELRRGAGDESSHRPVGESSHPPVDESSSGAGLPSAEAAARWDAIVAASAALTRTPQAFSAGHVERLHGAGLEDGEIVDMINGAAFFNWANRLMLSLGEPERIGA